MNPGFYSSAYCLCTSHELGVRERGKSPPCSCFPCTSVLYGVGDHRGQQSPPCRCSVRIERTHSNNSSRQETADGFSTTTAHSLTIGAPPHLGNVGVVYAHMITSKK